MADETDHNYSKWSLSCELYYKNAKVTTFNKDGVSSLLKLRVFDYHNSLYCKLKEKNTNFLKKCFTNYLISISFLVIVNLVARTN